MPRILQYISDHSQFESQIIFKNENLCMLIGDAILYCASYFANFIFNLPFLPLTFLSPIVFCSRS